MHNGMRGVRLVAIATFRDILWVRAGDLDPPLTDLVRADAGDHR
jgi:hypothetical protein